MGRDRDFVAFETFWIRERFILYLILILILILRLSFARHFSATGYLFIYAAVLLCLRLERLHSSPFFPPSPSPPFELFDRWGVANGLLIFFFLAKKMFKLKKFRFVASTRWFREDSIESFVCLVAFCFTIRECDLKL